MRAPAVASSVLVLLGVVACHPDAEPIVLAAAAPWHLDYTLGTRQGIELATRELNAAGGVRGRPLEIRWSDDGASGRDAVAAAELLVADRSVLGVIGHMNSDAMLSAARIYDGRLVAISPAATSPDLTGISPWVFRVITSDSANGATMAHFAVHTLGARQAAVLYENDAYGRGLAKAFLAQFTGTVGLVAPVAPVASDTLRSEFEPYVTTLAGLHPDVVFVAGLASSGTAILREAKRQHITAAFLGGDGWTGHQRRYRRRRERLHGDAVCHDRCTAGRAAVRHRVRRTVSHDARRGRCPRLRCDAHVRRGDRLSGSRSPRRARLPGRARRPTRLRRRHGQLSLSPER
jgi:Periplasmic binding protein